MMPGAGGAHSPEVGGSDGDSDLAEEASGGSQVGTSWRPGRYVGVGGGGWERRAERALSWRLGVGPGTGL